MWKSILPGEKLTPGDTIRHRPSTSSFSYRENIYEVVKAEVHYLEVVVKPGKDSTGEPPERKVIKYMDIGYHLALELWSAPVSLLGGDNKNPA